jgi:hypothetical protein
MSPKTRLAANSKSRIAFIAGESDKKTFFIL